jgi:hypothetical protein
MQSCLFLHVAQEFPYKRGDIDDGRGAVQD